SGCRGSGVAAARVAREPCSARMWRWLRPTHRTPHWALFILLVLVGGVDCGGCGCAVTGLVAGPGLVGNVAEPPHVDQVVTQEKTCGGSAPTVSQPAAETICYRTGLPVSAATIGWLAGLITAHRGGQPAQLQRQAQTPRPVRAGADR